MIPSSEPAQVVLVTGAGRGLGRAIACRLAANGASLVVNDCDVAAANETVAAIRDARGQAMAHVASVVDVDAVDKMVARIADEHGRLDALVSNAGVSSSGRGVANTDPDEVERLFRVHALGSFLVARGSLPLLRSARGHIILMSSVATSQWPRNGAPYAMAKAAVEALAWTLANEEERNGIRVNVVAPGLFDTRLGRELRDRLTVRHGDVASRLTMHDPTIIAERVSTLIGEAGMSFTRQRFVVGADLSSTGNGHSTLGPTVLACN